jgi:hypothetical protein
VPKAANSTVIETLQVKMKGEPSVSAKPFPKHALHGVPAEFEMPGLFVFTVVRNPITRLLSTYLDKVPQEKYRIKFNFHHSDTRKTFSLEDFLQKLKDGMIYQDIHWAPQRSILPYDLNKYDYIGKFENLENDLDYIMKEIFGEKFEIHTVNHHKTNSSTLLENISRREIVLIRNLYEGDFIQFGYDV